MSPSDTFQSGATRPEPSARGMSAADVVARLKAAGLPGLPVMAGNGEDEPAFHAPWEARIFALIVTLVEAGHFPWSEFQDRLATELVALEGSGKAAEETDTAGAEGINRYYYDCWLAAAEATLSAEAIVAPGAVDNHMNDLRAHVDGVRNHQLSAGGGATAGPLAQG